MAGQAALAIHNSQIYEGEAQLAANLARSNKELEQFAYVASHDLQEPLRMITGYTNLLSKRYKGKLDDDADEFIGYAVDGANRLRVLINDLLIYSRVGTQGKEFAPTDCELILGQTLVGLQVVIQESAARVTHDSLPTVMADDVQLGQLFQNLIGNALKYRNGNAPAVHIGCQRRDNDWLLSIRDNGIGIDPRFAEKIFVIFQRLHNREQYPGTGIGLAVCKRIVERHGGKIWVESTPGKGSTFYFTLSRKTGVKMRRLFSRRRKTVQGSTTFELLRHFSTASFASILIAMVIVAAILSVFYRNIALRDMTAMAERQNVALTRAFANSLWPQFRVFLASVTHLTDDELRSHADIAKLHAAVGLSDERRFGAENKNL